MIISENFKIRLREAVALAWQVFMRKVGQGTIVINKEASMQLQYSYILQQLLPLIKFKPEEKVNIELETSVKIKSSTKEIDLLLKGTSKKIIHTIAVEMKCYKTLASSGGLRGAQDIFMKDVYEDLQLLENYMKNNIANQGISLVMTDFERLVHPKVKKGKCWDYDISDSTQNGKIKLNTPIGGKPVSITLNKKYKFSWQQHGNYWFIELEGI